MRQVGNRVGQELSFSLGGLEQEIDFLNEMMNGGSMLAWAHSATT